MSRKTDNRKRITAFFTSARFRCILLYAGAAVLLFLLFMSVCTPIRYDLKVGSVSRFTVNATKDVTDEITTESRREAASAAVEPTYHFQDGVTEQVLTDLNTVLSELRNVQQYGLTLRDGDETESNLVALKFTDEEIAYAQGMITRITLTNYQVTTLLRTSTAKFEDMVSTLTTAARNQLNTTVREGQVSQSITSIQQIVGYRLDVSLTQTIIPTILRACLQPNMVIEANATEEARQKARDAVEPVVYLQGQNIIREGDKVSRAQYQLLSNLGMLKNDEVDFSVYYGAALIIAFALASMILLLRILRYDDFFNVRKTAVALIVIVVDTGLSLLLKQLFNIYLMPVALGTILITSLLGTRYGIASIIPAAILLPGLVAAGASTYLYEAILLLLMVMTTGIASVCWLRTFPQRVNVILCGLINALINVVVFYAISRMTQAEELSLTGDMLYAAAGGILSSVLALAIQPVFESIFRLPTRARLLELANPYQPLLRRLMLEAPGTYHHSIIVANLAEAACERIGGNPLLARAGAYYHDIGKLQRPQYFKENQVGENPHDHTDPYTSAQIVTRHPREGVLLSEKYRLPPEVQKIIATHHGDTPVMYFYHKALQMADGKPVDIRDFRYTGSRPQTLEAAVVMLADTVEAAVRSMEDPTPASIRKFIERLIRGKLEDGQLSESPITLRNLDEICDAFTDVMKAVFHERIEYPNVDLNAARQQEEQAARTEAESTGTEQKKEEDDTL